MTEKKHDSHEIRFGNLALQLGLISQEDLDTALNKQQQLKGLCIYRPIGTILVELDKLTETELKELINNDAGEPAAQPQMSGPETGSDPSSTDGGFGL